MRATSATHGQICRKPRCTDWAAGNALAGGRVTLSSGVSCEAASENRFTANQDVSIFPDTVCSTVYTPSMSVSANVVIDPVASWRLLPSGRPTALLEVPLSGTIVTGSSG